MIAYKFNFTISNTLKWLLLCTIVGTLVGSTTAFFLIALDAVTSWRENNLWLIYGLPIAGLCIGLLYHFYGGEATKGNNLLLVAHREQPTNNIKYRIPFAMAPLIFITTIMTHLVGGSAGREGTAVQMGGAIAAQFTSLFKLTKEQRQTVLIIGISAGFAAVFGTPLAGAVFALEIMLFKNTKITDIIPSIITAYVAHFVCLAWGVHHTVYAISSIPAFSFITIVWAIPAGAIFGLTAMLFTFTNTFWNYFFKKIKNKILIPVIGGLVLAIIIQYIHTTKYIGLGIPTIIDAFANPADKYDFLLKILFTSFTLSAGFKGGEVTPLFFIGATLGNILIWFIPLPMSLLAGMGFVAVFAGATHCSIASIILGIELFGWEAGVFIGIASVVAYFTSGSTGIYSAQQKQGVKYILYNYIKRISTF